MIHRIAIKGYKSLDVDFTLDPEVTVLVGRSGTGKSNIVEALRFFRSLIRNGGTRNISEWCSIYDIWAQPKPSDSYRLKFLVEYVVPTFSEHFKYEVCVNIDERGGEFIDNESLKIGDQTILSREGMGRDELPNVSGIPRLIACDLALPMLHGIREASFAFLALADSIGIYDFPLGIGKSMPQEQPTCKGLTDNGSNFRAVLDEIRADMSRITAWDDINAALQHLNPSISSVDMTALRGGDMLVTHRFGETLGAFPVEQESEGCRRFLVHLLALYQTPPKQTLVFEEPENGIHPGALQLLADEFKAAPVAKRGQVILTTHNPALLDFFAPESIRIVEMDNFRTKVSPLNERQLKAIQEDLIAPGEYLMFSGLYSNAESVGE